MHRGLVVILAAVVLDAIGIGLVFPILPRLLAEVTGEDDVSPYLGAMLALYSAMQFLFSPVLGVLSDRFGRRPVLVVSLAGAAVDYVVMAFAPSLWLLVVGRAIAGLTSANMAVATAYITDISDERERPARFGYFHAMFGVGFVIGPVLGGLLGDVWVRAPFLAAAALNAANLALALAILPESRPGDAGARFALADLDPFRPLGWAARLPALVPLLAIFVVLNFVGTMYGTVWALFGQDSFAWTSSTVGLSLGAFGVCHAAAQAFLTGPAVARLGERGALVLGMAFELAALAVLAFASAGWVVFVLAPLFALGGIGMPALQAITTERVGGDDQGRLQGVLASLVSLAAVFGPLFFGFAYLALKPMWPGAVWLVGGGLYLLALPLLLRVRRQPPKTPSSAATVFGSITPTLSGEDASRT